MLQQHDSRPYDIGDVRDLGTAPFVLSLRGDDLGVLKVTCAQFKWKWEAVKGSWGNRSLRQI